MSEHRIRSVISRFTTDYGMVLVLLAMGLVFSLATYNKQNPTGAAGAVPLAEQIWQAYGERAQVVILARKTEEAHAFSQALRQQLEQRGVTVVASAEGGPPVMRQALEQVIADGGPVNVIACNQTIARLGFLRNLRERFPRLANAEVMTPASYYWPDFLKATNLRAVANRVAVIAIIAIGMTFVIITAGIDLSVGSLIALSAVVVSLSIRELAGARQATPLGMTVCCLTAVAACGMIGAFSGLMVTLFRIPAFIVTLSMMQVASGLAYILSDSQSIYQLPDSFTWLGRGFLLGVPNAVVLMLILYAVAHVMMTRTTVGRYIYAVGGNPEAARLSGVPVRRVLLFCYVVCGALAGVGGVIRASELKSGAPTYGQMAELEIIAAVVVGGASLAGGEGKIFGTLIGALIIAVMRNGMNLTNIESNTQKVVLGLVILAAVLFDMVKKHGLSRRKV